jgi:hypothetical protein
MSMITKLEIAARQLDAGIQLIFEDRDPIPTHSLLFAASEMLKNLCDAAGLLSKVDGAVADLIKPEYQKDFHQLMRKEALFFKHAERDPNETIEAFDAEKNDTLALFAIERFRTLHPELSMPMAVFVAWLTWCHPNWLMDQPGAVEAKIQEVFRELNRIERLIFGRFYLMQHCGDERPNETPMDMIHRLFPTAYDKVMRAASELGTTMGLPPFMPPKAPKRFMRLPRISAQTKHRRAE